MISQKTIDEVKTHANIVEIVRDFVDLKKVSNNNYKGVCPFHKEKTPSFTVSETKEIYKCFGCDEGGDAIFFLEKHENMTFLEAIKHIAEKQGIPIIYEKDDAKAKAKREEIESISLLNNYAQEFYAEQLYSNQKEGLKYLKSRKFTDEVIKKFGLGYAIGNDNFTQKAEREPYPVELLKQAGLTNERGNDYFKNRVLFPISTHQGKIVGFGGRLIKMDEQTAKYLNTKETPVYDKSQLLFGLHQAKATIGKEKCCYVVEGYTDVLAFHEKGIENVVAVCGTALTSGHAQLLKKFSKGGKIILMFDGDGAGIKHSKRSIDIALPEEINLKIVLLPNKKDPYDFVMKQSKEDALEFIRENATNFIDFLISLTDLEELEPQEKTDFVYRIAQHIAKIPSSVSREFYLKHTAKKLEIEVQSLKETIEQNIMKNMEDQIQNALLLLQQNRRKFINDLFSDAHDEKDNSKITWNNQFLDLDIGSLVSLKSFEVEEGFTEVSINSNTYKLGQTNLQPPVMVVTEIVKEETKNLHLYDEETGITQRTPIKVHCRWYSTTKHVFCKAWFPIDVLLKIESDEIIESSFKVSDAVCLKTKTKSNQQKVIKTSIEQAKNKNVIGIKNITSHLNIPPNMVVMSVESIPEKEKQPIFHKSTGERKRIVSTKRIKCMWYNPKEDKFSQDYFSSEILILANMNTLKDDLTQLLK